MKTISLKFLGNGKRTTWIDMHGFEGPAASPLFDGGNYYRKGQITGAYTVTIPPNGEFQVVDTQYNRERLRILTRPSERLDEKQEYAQMENKWTKKLVKTKVPPFIQVLDGTPIEKDLKPAGQTVDPTEIAKLKAEIKAKNEKIRQLEEKDLEPEVPDTEPPPAPLDLDETPAAPPAPEVELEEEDGPKMETHAERNARVFANKVEPTG